MENLPNDMILEILKNIKTKGDIVNCSLVSKKFKKFMDTRRSCEILNIYMQSATPDYSQNLKIFLNFWSEFFEYPRRPRRPGVGGRSALKLWWVSRRGSKTLDALLPTMW